MSTQPTPTPTPPPAPVVYEPVVELIRTQRQNVGYALTALAAVFLVTGVMLVVKSNRLSAATTTATDKTKDGKDADDPFKSLPDAVEAPQANRFDYIVGAFGAALGLLVTGAGAAFLIVGLPKPTELEQRREARVLILALGGLLGAFLILIGVWFFYRWSDSLVKWLDKGELKEARWVLIPLLMVVAGGGIMFTAVQPARAEERNNTTIRRLVYGSNFGLTILILFVVLVIANAVVAMRVPNKLDTTSTGFYTLNDQTKQLLESLDQPIRAFAIFQDGADPVTDDTKRLLKSAEDANPSKFQVRFLSPALNRDEISKLRVDYPLAEMSGEGVLLVAGEDGVRNRHSFIRGDEFAEEKAGPEGRPIATFNGEPKLLRELMFLAENKNKPKVYFTQSSGELALAPGGRGRADARRSATGLKAYLEKNYFDVQPLVFDETAAAKVPDDAAVVLVADPIRPIPAPGVEAIRKFMTEPRPDGKKGKLVVLVGAQSGADGKVLQTGLESILQPFGVGLSERFLYAAPSPALERFDGTQGIRTLQVGIAVAAVRARNPVAMGFNKLDRVEMVDCRELTSNPAGTFSSTTVLLSLPDRVTWQTQKRSPPDEAARDLVARLDAIRKAPSREEAVRMRQAVTKELDVSDESRELAVFVSEGQTARVAVFGCGWFVSDEAGSQATGRFGARGATLWLDLMGSTLDWVRDRPTVIGVTEKPYTSYTLKPGYDNPRLIYVPLGIGVLIVFGLGAGVWVIRRK